MKYSVIIPVYNAAATIGRCLDSLLSQSRGDMEILLINDGSTDDSGRICRNYAQQHDCVCYYEKENGGVSSARNLGLERASGEYILFVDSDDYVTDDYLAVIDEAMARWHPDMLCFGLNCVGERQDVWQTGVFFSEDPLEIGRFVWRAAHAYLFSNLMTRCFRAEIIRQKNIRFDESLRIGEDHAFVFSYTMYVKRIASIEGILYNYSRDNRNSLSQRNREYLPDHLLRLSYLMSQVLDGADQPSAVRRYYLKSLSWSHYRSVYSSCKELRKFDLSTDARRAKIRQICDQYGSAAIRPVGLRTWLIALPVLLNMTCVIDHVSCHSEYCRKII